MIVLEILFVTYVIGVCLWTLLIGFAVIRLGGFQEFADRANFISGESEEDMMLNSNRVQWLVAIMVVLWPLVPVYLTLTLRDDKS